MTGAYGHRFDRWLALMTCCTVLACSEQAPTESAPSSAVPIEKQSEPVVSSLPNPANAETPAALWQLTVAGERYTGVAIADSCQINSDNENALPQWQLRLAWAGGALRFGFEPASTQGESPLLSGTLSIHGQADAMRFNGQVSITEFTALSSGARLSGTAELRFDDSSLPIRDLSFSDIECR
jgi:hypothetical protein